MSSERYTVAGCPEAVRQAYMDAHRALARLVSEARSTLPHEEGLSGEQVVTDREGLAILRAQQSAVHDALATLALVAHPELLARRGGR